MGRGDWSILWIWRTHILWFAQMIAIFIRWLKHFFFFFLFFLYFWLKHFFKMPVKGGLLEGLACHIVRIMISALHQHPRNFREANQWVGTEHVVQVIWTILCCVYTWMWILVQIRPMCIRLQVPLTSPSAPKGAALLGHVTPDYPGILSWMWWPHRAREGDIEERLLKIFLLLKKMCSELLQHHGLWFFFYRI